MSRRTWTYTLGGRPLSAPVEVTPGAEPEGFNASAERMPVFTDRYLEGDRAPDGTDIGSRAKRRDWMRQAGVADASDYRQYWERARQQREAWRSGQAPVSREMETTVGRIAHDMRTKGRR